MIGLHKKNPLKKMFGLASLAGGMVNIASLSAAALVNPAMFGLTFLLLFMGAWWLTR